MAESSSPPGDPVVDARRARFQQVGPELVARLRSYVVRRCRADLVDDVVAEALLVIWRRLDDIPELELVPWSYGVARNCLANAERSQRRQRRLHARMAGLRESQDEVPAHEPNVTDPALHAALARLHDLDRELVRLWAWEELQPREIAVVLGLTPNAVSIRLHRLRARLAGQLAAPDGDRALTEVPLR